MVRGVELGEQIGVGAFGAVYRADQPSVGREVAVKVVRPELADNPTFIRRFEAEAQIVARLEHPHIVPLYDYWREPGGAFLVMRYLRGGTAEQALTDGDMSVELVARIVQQVGGALAAAHESGVLHRDVKPSNILLDERGDTYLTDFGIAVDTLTETTGGVSAGSPLYAPPEQVAGGQVTVRSDVYSLAVTVFELLAGRAPFAADTIDDLYQIKMAGPTVSLAQHRPDLPAEVGVVLARAMAGDPSSRFDTVAEFADTLLDTLGTARTQTTTAVAPGGRSGSGSTIVKAEIEIPNPYKGLRAFGEADASDFHGREDLTNLLVQAVGGSRFVIVVGASGSGKSSAVRAGLIPAVRGGAIPGSESWFVTTVTPGQRPFEQLEAALLKIAVNPPERLLAQLEDGERGLARTILRVLPDDDAQLLLVVDQFEELFTLANPDTRTRFLEALASVAGDESSRVRIVCTVRADFYDGPLSHPAIGELVRDNSVPVSPMNRQELSEAITAPAQHVGVTIEPALVARLVDDVIGAPGSLPMLQYTLTELFDQRRQMTMTEAAYNTLGGITGAIAARAEDIYTQLDETEQAAARRMFERLVNLGEGTEDTRRRVTRHELADDNETGTVIDAYGQARLLSFDRNPNTRTPTIEVAHEALIREWPRLRAWIDEDRDQLRVLNHLATAATAWDQRGRDTADLYRGARLDTANEFTSTNTDLTPLEAEFINASITDAETERNRQKKINRRLRNLLTAAAVLLVVAAGASVLAVNNAHDADRSADEATVTAREATIDRMAAVAVEQTRSDRSLAVLLGAELVRVRPGAESAEVFRRTLIDFPAPVLERQLDPARVWELDPTGTYAAGAEGTDVTVVEIRTGDTETIEIPTPVSQPILAVSSGAARIVVADRSSLTVFAIETVDGTLRSIEMKQEPTSVALSQDGSAAVINWADTGNNSGVTGVYWTIDSQDTLPAVTDITGSKLVAFTVGGEILRAGSVSFESRRTTADGSVFRAASSPYVTASAVNQGDVLEVLFRDEQLSELLNPSRPAGVVAIAGTDDRIVTGTSRGTVRLWGYVSGDEVRQMTDIPGQYRVAPEWIIEVGTEVVLPGAGPITRIVVDTDRRLALAATATGQMAVIDLDDGAQLGQFQATSTAIDSLAISPDGLLTVTDIGGLVTRWRLDAKGPLFAPVDTDEPSRVLGETVVLSVTQSGLITPVSGTTEPVQIAADENTITSSVMSSDGTTLAVAETTQPCAYPATSCSTEIHVLDTETLQLHSSFSVPSTNMTALAITGDGEHVLVGVSNGSVQIWSADGRRTNTLPLPDGADGLPVAAIDVLTPIDGTELIAVAWTNGAVAVWQGFEPAQPRSYSHTADSTALALKPDGFLAIGRLDGTIAIVDHTNPDSALWTLDGHSSAPLSLEMSSDGTVLLSSTSTETKVWDLTSRHLLATLPNSSQATPGSPDGLLIHTSGAGGTNPLIAPPGTWDLHPQVVLAAACDLTGRPMTEEEWDQYLPDGEPYEPSCALGE